MSSSGGTSTTSVGSAYADSVRHDYSSNVTTGAWVQLIAATAAVINGFMIFDSSGKTLELGVGGSGSESRILIIPPGGFGHIIPIKIAAGSRLAIKAISGTASAGEFDFTGVQ